MVYSLWLQYHSVRCSDSYLLALTAVLLHVVSTCQCHECSHGNHGAEFLEKTQDWYKDIQTPEANTTTTVTFPYICNMQHTDTFYINPLLYWYAYMKINYITGA